MSESLPDEIACPRCGAGLDTAPPSRLCCVVHGEVGGRNSKGIWVFDQEAPYWGEVQQDLMQQILSTGWESHWQTALEAHLRPAHPHLVDYVQHAARGDWFVLLPLDRDRTVALDVGAGWGANSFALAAHVKRVYAVENTTERIEFVALRAAQDRCTGVIPVQGNLHALPFRPGSIDVIVVNGVLEWAGLIDPEAAAGSARRSPLALQEQFLRRLATLLRPGGTLYVGIENRFGHMFFRGTPDHQGLRYTSLMPKPVARAYTWVRASTSPRTHVTERDYRTWIYSYGGYARLLQRCGFTDLVRYAMIPGYNVPTSIVPLETKGPMRYLARRARGQSTLRDVVRRGLRMTLARSGLEARLASCFALVARRGPEAQA